MPGSPVYFLEGNSEVRAQLRGHDWRSSPLGAPASWPQLLKSLVGCVLESKFPMFLAWGADLTFIYNDAYKEMLGDAHTWKLGQSFREAWSELWEEITPLTNKTLQGEAVYLENYQVMLTRKGSPEPAWFTFSYSPLRDENAVVQGLWCTCIETTREVLAQRQDREEIRQLHELFQQAPGFMALVREPGHVFEIFNQAFQQLLGYRELEGKTAREAMPELEGQGFFELAFQVYATGLPYIGKAMPARLQRKPGAPLEERMVDFVFQPVRTPDGKVTAIFVQGNDVTEAAQAQQALIQESLRKDDFLAMLAHELRNPLAPINSAAELLRQAQLSEEKIQFTSRIITRQVTHLGKIVDDLLDVSRVTRGLVTLQKEIVCLTNALEDAVEQVQTSIAAKRQLLAMPPPADIIWVHGDRTRLTQIFTNILSNATRYTQDHGSISIQLAAEPDTVTVAFTDNGIGISQDLMPHVFDLFSQAERSADRSQGGLGLGLALVKSLVELHGGRVTAASAGLGKGSTFSVILPRVHAPLSSPSEDERAEATSLASSAQVLVVDDNVDAATTLAMLLETMGYEVLIEHGARAALERARAVRPQVMFLDIGLPEMTGYELARHLRTTAESAHSKLIALTGYGREEDERLAVQAGFDHYMVKPAKLENIARVMQQALSHAHGRPDA